MNQPKDFLPEYKAVPTPMGWRPSYRLFAGERERMVPYKGGHRYFTTMSAAVAEAKEYVRGLLNPVIRAEVIEPDAMLDEVAEWRQRKEAEAAEEKARAFLGPETLFTKGRQVVVERRRAR